MFALIIDEIYAHVIAHDISRIINWMDVLMGVHDKRDGIRSNSCSLSNLESSLSKGELITLLEFMYKSLSCEEKDDFIGLFPIIKELIPFDHASAVLGYRNIEGITVIDGINISYPDQFCREYKLRNYFQRDAVVRGCFTTSDFQYWCVERRRPCQPEELVSFAADFGMREGYAKGSRPFGNGKLGSMFSFASSTVNPETRIDAIMELTIPHLHLALSRVYNKRRFPASSITLTNREREILNWVKQGKSSWDISVILSITERTVNFHIYNIMQKLGTINRTQSVAVAAHLGLIDYE
jgi:DNA-binding CsgD family transcriptional regulator